jgi:hypothetical protein
MTNLKATGLALLVAGALCGGAIVSAQAPGPDMKNGPEVRSESDRLQAMEATLDRIVQLLEGRGASHDQGYQPRPDLPKGDFGVMSRRYPAGGALKAAPSGPGLGYRRPAAGKAASPFPEGSEGPEISAALPKQPAPPAAGGPSAAAVPYGPVNERALDVSGFMGQPGGQGGRGGSAALEQRVVELERRVYDLERQLASLRDGRWSKPSQPGANRPLNEAKK